TEVSVHASRPALTNPLPDGSHPVLEQRSKGNQLSPGQSNAGTSADNTSGPQDNITNEQVEEGSHHGTAPLGDSQPLDSLFIGDMNPEGVFITANSPGSLRSGAGIWLAEKLNQSARRTDQFRSPQPSSLFYGFTTAAQQAFLPILAEECISILPPV